MLAKADKVELNTDLGNCCIEVADEGTNRDGNPKSDI